MFRGKGKSVAEVDGDSYDLEVVGADEGQDGVAYGRRIDVGLDAAQGVEDGDTALVDVAVGLCDIIDFLVGEAIFAHYVGVHPEVGRGVMGDDYVRGNVARNAASTLYQTPFAHTGVLMQHGVGGENHTVVHAAVAGDDNAVADNGFSGDYRVMTYVAVGHYERIVADDG